MKEAKKIQILISAVAIATAIIHVTCPSLKIDAITLALVVLAVAPWLAPLIKTLELPGGIKFEFQDLERVAKEVAAAGLTNDKLADVRQDYTFMDVAESNPGLAIAGLRIELEKSLKKLYELSRKGNLIISHYGSIFQLMNDLYDKQVITNQEKTALADMIGTLNKAVHGEELDYRATQWIIDIGPKILGSINNKIKKREIARKMSNL
jgi:hypothetical protein